MPGVKQVVKVGDSAVAVVAERWWQAKTALDALPTTWDGGENAKVSSATIAEFLKGGLDAEQTFVGNAHGDVKQAMANAAKKVEAVYAYPYQNHATMEPMNTTALYTADRCEAWVPTQVAEAALASVSEASGLPIAKCDVHKMPLGGGFGRRTAHDYVQQAVAIAKQMVGTPVKLIWSREEDMTHGRYHPVTQAKMVGAFDANDNLTALHMRISGQSILAFVNPQNLQNGKDPFVFQGLNPGGTEGVFGYTIPNLLIDVDREFAAFGAANISSALSQGFVVTGADSRTAVGVAAGGRTQVTGLVAATAIAAVLLFLTEPLRYVPVAALGAVLVFAALSLFDVGTLREIWKYDRLEVGLSLITTLGVVAVGAINGILIAVALALARFVRQAARPRDEVLGKVDGLPGFHSIERHGAAAKTFPRLVLFRFNGPLTFFNADYFKQRALAAADAAGKDVRWFVIDAIPISNIDVNGLYALRDLNLELEAHGTTLIFAGRRTEFLIWLREIGLYQTELDNRLFPSLTQALKAYRREILRPELPPC